MSDARSGSGWAIDLHDGALVTEKEAAHERRTLIWTYCMAWLFGMAMCSIYTAIYGDFDWYYAGTIIGLLVGLLYGFVVFNPHMARKWAVAAPVMAAIILLVSGAHLRQPGVNNYLLVPLVFSTFFLWRHRNLYLVVSGIMIAAFCILPLAIGGSDELRRVVIGGPIFTVIAVLAFTLVRRAGKLQLERSTFQSTVSSLLTALNARDGVTREKALRTVQLAELVALEMGLSVSDREQVRYAAYLHDIGKLGVPNELLSKPGPLTADEWVVLREHPVIGERIVRNVPGFADVAVIVRHEHECWNGSGYPDGLSGDRIPVESRIIHACDAYAAMTADRSYADSVSRAEIRTELEARAGTQFDPDVVSALLSVIGGRNDAPGASVLDLSLRLAG